MEWLTDKRVGLLSLKSNSVNDAIAKGVVKQLSEIGFMIETDEGASESYTWVSVSDYKLIVLPEKM